MYSSEQIYLMIASSSDKLPIQKRSQPKTTPLVGVKHDVAMFKRKYKDNNLDHILSSRDCKTLLPKVYIENWLRTKFMYATGDIYLFYTGHGHANGDWAVETQQKPNGDSFSLQLLVQIWTESGNSFKVHLYIFMDSCHSAGWCERLAKIDHHSSISIFASCTQLQLATDMEGGGLLNRCLLGVDEDEIQQELRLLFCRSMKQTPQFINGSQKGALTAEQIMMLAKDLKNASKIKKSGQSKVNKLELIISYFK